MIRVGIIGGSGYGGGELLRLLAGHGKAEVFAVTSRSSAGCPVADAHPSLLGTTKLSFTDREAAEVATEVDCLFFALPHGETATRMAAVFDSAPDVRVVDLSGDFRLKDAAAWESAYEREHPCPDLVPEFVYGLCEANRKQIATATRVANPGCFATGAALALLPLAEAGRLAGSVVVNGVTGSSGSGAAPKAGTHHPERASDFRAYRPLAHQHEPEITMALADAGAAGFRLAMVPHSAPLVRGIFTTAYVFPDSPLSAERLREIYVSRYGPERFIRLRDDSPRLAVVAGTNWCDIGVASRDDAVVVLSAIDNLVKGMAGQAVQNMNLMFGLPEDEGLRFPGMHP
jgi:N-acetyl-gamma-glutamyl-phosphate reductase